MYQVLNLKIPKGQSESVNQRTVNTMAKRKDRQYNGQKKKRTKTNLQNITHKTQDRVTRTPLKTGAELRCSC